MKKISAKTRNTIILIIALIVLAAGAYAAMRIAAGPKEPALYAVVEVFRKSRDIYDLSEDREFVMEDGLGGYNVIEIKDGAIQVTEANCPDQICVYSLPLSEAGFGGLIACLPHGLYITVVSEEDLSDE